MSYDGFIMNIKEYYSTSDLALTATLSLFYSIEAIDRQNPYKAQFLFKRDEQLDKLIEAYWRGELKVNPQVYFNQLKVIKSRIYEGEY
ncbi:MAG: hypothetical protein A2953_00940 [Candidatus Levybacteria bacterium RIFCSPLOWO2_01_FULL_36_54]|nr:MAG: hypothetical protein A2953_00940 [Candidatus Levybacteria bacterium RIFCSPLOWO2_01_FULL_36_54]